jgi:hypothetical protein
MTATQTDTKHRYIGVTDECVQCQYCGKDDLKSTVVLAILDGDGNEEEITYYGSTCAARALSIRGGGRAVLQAARWAQEKTAIQARDARGRLALYDWPETGDPDARAIAAALPAWIERNRNFAQVNTLAACDRALRDARAYDQAAIAEAALVGV